MSLFSSLKQPFYLLIIPQTVVTVLLGLIGWGVAGSVTGYSLALGGIVCVIPNMYFALKAFISPGGVQAGEAASALYKGEAGKFVLTIVIFGLVFSLVKPLEPLALFGGMVVVQAVNWISPMLLNCNVEESK